MTKRTSTIGLARTTSPRVAGSARAIAAEVVRMVAGRNHPQEPVAAPVARRGKAAWAAAAPTRRTGRFASSQALVRAGRAPGSGAREAKEVSTTPPA